MMPLSFHPQVSEWFERRFGAPTPPQRDAWPAIQSGAHVLIAAPTGSGKTLAAFLSAIDILCQRASAGVLADETSVLYISPLKALSRDIEYNLQAPLNEIHTLLGLEPGEQIRTAVRSGDTPARDRAAILKKPPHLLVTTPESLYLLLTSAGGRALLRAVNTVIIDEIHALAPNKRGAHLALSLARLDSLVQKQGLPPVQRIGLSATQNPIKEVARFLVGGKPGVDPDCAIIDHGHGRALDLAICVPRSPLEAITSAEVQSEIYDQLAELISGHKSTLIFTNTRKLTERVTRFLAERIGADLVTSHHGSLSKKLREDAEQRLREGRLRALVATASLELGIDVGDIDLVCQVGSPGSVSTLLQRVGRSGHVHSKTPKGRLFPQSRDDLVECVALLDCVRRGELDRTVMCRAPLDILAQQIIARLADSECHEDELFSLVTRAAPYAALKRETFQQVLTMVSEGFATSGGRRGAFVHRDETTGRIRGRRGARLAALTSGGAIPDNFDYEVLLEPTSTRIGSLNEDFAVESSAGDVFQLGNMSYQILKIEAGVVRVRDAAGTQPNLPFWLGEAPSRANILSEGVSRLRTRIAQSIEGDVASFARCTAELSQELQLPMAVLEQVVDYLGQSCLALGEMPSRELLIAERFFDETGSMHIVIHSSYGMRINRAYALTLRKRFCRSFNVELQAAAGEDAILLSLGPMHSFPLDELWQYVRSPTARDVLCQALLDSPLFQTRFRWNATRSLAVLRFRGGKKTPPRFQRMQADDLLALCFPDQVACLENITGDREIPDHPLVNQTIWDSLTEAMDIDGLLDLLVALESGAVRVSSRDVTEPSLIAHEIITAKPYTFLDDAPLEERRAQAIFLRRKGLPESVRDLGKLDQAAISDVQREAEPDPRDPEELHDALSTYVFATREELQRWEAQASAALVGPLADAGRLVLLDSSENGLATVPRFDPLLRAALAGSAEALREVVRGRLEWCGPICTDEVAHLLERPVLEVESALCALEAEGFVLRGRFRDGRGEEFCERRLLARIHRRTIGQLRRQIAPASPSEFVEFLCAFQGASREHRRRGLEGLRLTLEQLNGVSVPASAWERAVLPVRVVDYSAAYLDQLSLMGQVTWRAAGESGKRLHRMTPIILGCRSGHGSQLLMDSGSADLVSMKSGSTAEAAGVRSAEVTARQPVPLPMELGADARRVARVLADSGACFFPELARASSLLPAQAELAVSELAARGRCATDGMSGLRTLIASAVERRRAASPARGHGRHRGAAGPLGLDWAGRIAWLPTAEGIESSPATPAQAHIAEQQLIELAWRLLRRWGVVFRRLLAREPDLPPWRDLLRVYFRLEARGEIRGGRFVSGFAGEQFALPQAVQGLRRVTSGQPSSETIEVSPADPLNLVGILTPDPLVPRSGSQRIRITGGQFTVIHTKNSRSPAPINPTPPA